MSNDSKIIFNKLKTLCVPILGDSLLTPSSIPRISQLLTNLIANLREVQSAEFVLNPSLVSYVFFPLSTILRRNVSSAIPDQILEKILVVLSILWESWWWSSDVTIWEQVFVLCGSVIGGVEGIGKDKTRDDETKTAATQCLMALLRGRFVDDDTQASKLLPNSELRLTEFRAHSQTTKFIPILGETISSLLLTAQSQHLPLQRTSLQVLHILIVYYAPSGLLPSVLPGTISSLCRVVLNKSGRKQWANGAIVALALIAMQGAILGSIGDDVCIQEGAVRGPQNIEDLTQLLTEPAMPPAPDQSRPYMTSRTPVWLRGTSSQLHIALNTLTPLVSHPSPAALVAFSRFSSAILSATLFTLPQSQSLFLSFLLSLSNSTFQSVSLDAQKRLLALLSPTSTARSALISQLIQNTRDNLALLPRILPHRADEKIIHIAGLIEAVCRLAAGQAEPGLVVYNLSPISNSIGKLLGPVGGVEKWGWSLLSVLQFESPPVAISRTSAAQLMLESGSQDTHLPFPDISFKDVAAPNAREALVRMFRSLGSAAGESCFFSVEWFLNVGISGKSPRSVAALWCACRFMEGVGRVHLDTGACEDPAIAKGSRRLDKMARGMARAVAELWNERDEAEYVAQLPDGKGEDDSESPVQHVEGVIRLPDTLDVTRTQLPKPRHEIIQTTLLQALSLQMLSIAAGILQTRFTPLLLHSLYPVLHSLVSTQAFLSSSAFAALNFISTSTSYASIANLLFSNFDYALDAVSRRLTRRWLDVDATKVLVILVRLIGSDVVHKAGDIVEECFDRLDDFHGYEVVVEGLLEVLGEVMSVIKVDEEPARSHQVGPDAKPVVVPDKECLDAFAQWYPQRNNPPLPGIEELQTPPHPAGPEDEEAAHSKSAASDMKDSVQMSGEEATLDPAQKLARQIVSRSLYFLSHESPVIRARILMLLSTSTPVLPESGLLPSIHQAWPFILNRLADSEPFVVGAAASLITSLANHFGDFMFRRIWDDVWPRFRTMLKRLDAADATNALARRGYGAVGTETAYSHSHRLYRSLLQTMTAVSKNVQVQDSLTWQVIIAFRRFLHNQAHEELQRCARDLYIGIGSSNGDAVWLALEATAGRIGSTVSFLREAKWDIESNLAMIYSTMDMA